MSDRLKILLVEDSADDAELIAAHLEGAGYRVDWHRVQDREALAAALDGKGWDLLITDYDLPGFNGLDVLREVASRHLDIPRIVVSGAVSEESAVRVMKAGAHDFIAKDRMMRLVPAIERELADAARRAEHREAQALVDAQARLLGEMTSALGEGVMVVNPHGRLMFMNPEAERLLGWRAAELRERNVHETIHFQRADGSPYPESECPLARVAAEGIPFRSQDGEVFVHKDGTAFPVSYVATPIIDSGSIVASVTAFQDISARKAAEAALHASREELRALTAYLNTVREAERTHIAHELHDELGQMLTAIKMDLSWLRHQLPEASAPVRQKFDGMTALLDETVESVRRISSSLRPRLLDDLGLGPAIDWMLDGFRKRTGIRCHVYTSHEDFDCDAQQATALFRICQESLTNIARHAEASEVWVDLVQDGQGITLSVRDNGKGMDIAQASRKHSFGLLGMQERGRSVGGDVRIESAPGQGTEIEVSVPRGGAGGQP